jgi:hypothetical protein
MVCGLWFVVYGLWCQVYVSGLWFIHREEGQHASQHPEEPHHLHFAVSGSRSVEC